MRKQFAVILLAAAATALPALSSTITLSAISPVTVGSTFDVAVQVTNVFSGRSANDLLEAYGFNVLVGNSSLFTYVGETAGSLFDDASALFGGTPMVAGFAQNPAGIGPADFSGPLTLAVLHFKALAPGASSISVTWNSADLNQGLVFANLPYDPIAATTAVTAIVTVPEPAAPLVLLLPALVLALRLLPLRGRRAMVRS